LTLTLTFEVVVVVDVEGDGGVDLGVGSLAVDSHPDATAGSSCR
jgi:hypothetical protein